MISKLPQYTFQDGLITANVGKCSSENMASYEKNDQWKDYAFCSAKKRDALKQLLNEYESHIDTCRRDLSTKESDLDICSKIISSGKCQQANSESTVAGSYDPSNKGLVVKMIAVVVPLVVLVVVLGIVCMICKKQRQQNMLFEQQLQKFKQLEDELFKAE